MDSVMLLIIIRYYLTYQTEGIYMTICWDDAV